MYCTKCGMQNIDNAMFCKNCGASLLVQAQAQAEENFVNEETKQEGTIIAEPANAWEEEQEDARVEENPVIALIKKHATSKLFFIATLLVTISVGLSLLSSMFGSLFSTSEISFSFSTGYVSVASVIALIALWRLNTMGKKQGVDKAGFIMLKVTSIIELVTSIFAFSLIALCFVILGAISAWEPDIFNGAIDEALGIFAENGFAIDPSIHLFFTSEAFVPFAFLIATLLIGACVIVAIFYSKVLKTIKTVTNMAEKGVIYKNITNGIIGWLFAIGAISAMSLLTGDVIGALTGASYIIFAIVLINFKKEAEELVYVVEEQQQPQQEI